MRDYKWGKFLIFMLGCALLGAVIGGGVRLFMSTGNLSVINDVFNQFTPNLFIISFVCGIIGMIGYFYFNNLLKKDRYSNEEGSVFDRHENKISIVMNFSTICAIINFTAFGLNSTKELGSMYFVLFTCNVILAFMGEVANISLVKKVRPELNADPVNPGFKKEYFDQLDEFEKIKLGKACFKTVSAMVPAYVFTFVICFLLIATLEVSPIICLPIGILWLIQTVIMLYHSCKQK